MTRIQSTCLATTTAILLVFGGLFALGCGSGSASSLFFDSGLFPLTIGSSGGTPPAPIDDEDEDDADDGDGGGDAATSICITFRNDGNDNAGVALYTSPDPTISFQGLVDTDNLALMPSIDQGCQDFDMLDGPFAFAPIILDGLNLNFQIDCGFVGSIAFSVIQEFAPLISPDDTAGPFRQGIDFVCGQNLIIEITDDDLDGDFEIGF